MWGKKDRPTDYASEGQELPSRPEPSDYGRQQASASQPVRNVQRPPSPRNSTPSRLARSVNFEGEIQGAEDLVIEGNVKGKVVLEKNLLAIGPNSRVEADIIARNLVLSGTLIGNVKVAERIQIKATGSLQGSLLTHRISIQDGGRFCGQCDIQVPAQPKPKPKPKPTAERPQRPSRPARPAPTHSSRPQAAYRAPAQGRDGTQQ